MLTALTQQAKVVLTFCERGDAILCEEFAYPSALATSAPYGITTVPIALDSVGLREDALEETLRDWDESKRGTKRPHVVRGLC